jgi:hypothetical protein
MSTYTHRTLVAEFELALDAKALDTLRACFEASRHLYNAVLGEGRKRLKLMRESKDFQRARKLPKISARTMGLVSTACTSLQVLARPTRRLYCCANASDKSL